MSVPHRKRRAASHLMEESSVDLTKSVLPPHWVIRKYQPDYGLDLAIEVFEPILEGEFFETLGEHFFVQLKSVKTFASTTVSPKPRMNVAKFPLSTPLADTTASESLDVYVISHPLESSLLSTVQAMGSSTVVFLFVAALDVQRVFFVCLNDYIDKIVVPNGSAHLTQGSVTVYIPLANEIRRTSDGNPATDFIRFMAKRSKLYSAFSLARFQHSELAYCPQPLERRRMASHFATLLSHLDIWDNALWPILDDYRKWIDRLNRLVRDTQDWASYESLPQTHLARNFKRSDITLDDAIDEEIRRFWAGLDSLGRNYEEICREWRLPTYMEALRQKPDPGKVPFLARKTELSGEFQ